MNLALILAAVLGGLMHPMPLTPALEAERAVAITVGEYALVAYLPENLSSHTERARTLSDRADAVAAETGMEVLLTDDLLTYLCLKRIEQRGASDYERRVLAARLSHGKGTLLYATPTENAA